MIVVKSVYDRADQGGSERGSESGCCERVGGAVRRGEVRRGVRWELEEGGSVGGCVEKQRRAVAVDRERERRRE